MIDVEARAEIERNGQAHHWHRRAAVRGLAEKLLVAATVAICGGLYAAAFLFGCVLVAICGRIGAWVLWWGGFASF